MAAGKSLIGESGRRCTLDKPWVRPHSQKSMPLCLSEACLPQRNHSQTRSVPGDRRRPALHVFRVCVSTIAQCPAKSILINNHGKWPSPCSSRSQHGQARVRIILARCSIRGRSSSSSLMALPPLYCMFLGEGWGGLLCAGKKKGGSSLAGGSPLPGFSLSLLLFLSGFYLSSIFLCFFFPFPLFLWEGGG